jgi:TonB family protein
MTCTRRSVIPAFVVAVLFTSAFANQKEDEAKALVARAMSTSAIRDEGSPPFRLKANVKVTQEDGSTVEGTYTETWISNSQWRRETALGEFHRTQVVLGRKSWTSDNSTVVPERLAAIPTTFDPWIGFANPWKVAKFENQEVDGKTTRCFRTKPEMWGVSELCFESNTGTLAARIVPVHLRNKTVNGLCIYRDYRPLGDRRVPTFYACLEDKKVRLEAQVVELTLRPEVDDSFFAPSSDGKERAHCPTRTQPPRLVQNEEPYSPGGEKGIVTISLSVGTDGKPHDLEVVDSPNKASENAALEAVRQWKFKPAICEGEPMDVEITVEIDFH